MTAKERNAIESEILRALQVLTGPGGVVEMRIPDHPRGKCTTAGYFDDWRKLATAALNYDGWCAGVYFTLNEINPALLARANNRAVEYIKQTTADADVIRRRFLPFDFDPVRPAGIPSTDAEHRAALDRAQDCHMWLASQGWPSPVYADSGNGAHLLYDLDLPNDPATTRLIEQCLRALEGLFSDGRVGVDTSVSNAARIWKLYGTRSRKGDGTRDRPHRTSGIVTVPEVRVVVPRDLLEGLAVMAPPEPPCGARKGARNGR
jgi:hypothetical protein